MTKFLDDIIEDILRREGGFVDHPADKGGPTCWGISKRSHPEAWLNGPPTKEEAKQIYLKRYVYLPKFDKVEDPDLQAQLVDFGVHSGPAVATQKLQTVLGVKADGVIGPKTLMAVDAADKRKTANLLVMERLRMFARIVAKSKNQAVFLSGWINRALEFFQP